MTIFRCPVCAVPLHRTDTTYHCDHGHNFDIARQGYVNLLLAHQRRSNQAGDSRTMVEQRRAFLSRGYYTPLTTALIESLQAITTPPQATLLDLGCGEGYYLATIAQTLGDAWHYYGIDISKAAIKLAARRTPALALAVANAHYLPVQDHSADVVLIVFAPYNAEELARICKPTTRVVLVTPDRGHLHELRAHLYDDVRPYSDDRHQALAQYFARQQVVQVTAQITLTTRDDIQALLQMTPFYWQSPADRQAALLQHDTLDLTLSFAISHYQLLS